MPSPVFTPEQSARFREALRAVIKDRGGKGPAAAHLRLNEETVDALLLGQLAPGMHIASTVARERGVTLPELLAGGVG